jgi:UDP-N-acetylmuramate: L-alanyl-gamma-D-glutamyl-meso-diaminopimelate ligase
MPTPPVSTTTSDAHLRQFDRPPFPDPAKVRTVYFIGICGTGMGALAGLFKQAGYEVSGADDNVYPPMSTQLAEWGIPVHKGFDPAHLEPAPDLVIVGNACRPTHPEAAYAREKWLVQMSFPEAVGHFFIRGRHGIVVAGTHGKSTTTALLAHTLTALGTDPSYLMGAVSSETGKAFRLGEGEHFAIEGDEYDTAYFDKRPKFLHYRPQTAIITSVEHDHVDIYPELALYKEQFRKLVDYAVATRAENAAEKGVSVADLPGQIVCCLEDDNVRGLVSWALYAHPDAPLVTYGFREASHYRAGRLRADGGGTTFDLIVAAGHREWTFDMPEGTTGLDGQTRMTVPTDTTAVIQDVRIPLSGHHNVLNALAVIAALDGAGIAPPVAARAMLTFPGIKRRQEVFGEVGGVTIIDDFAHHPTAVRETLRAIRARYGDRRIVAVFEPRSNSSRTKVFQAAYAESFHSADEVVLSETTRKDGGEASQKRFSSAELAHDLSEKGITAASFDGPDAIVDELTPRLNGGEVVLVMSNGSFGGIHRKLLDALAMRFATGRD